MLVGRRTVRSATVMGAALLAAVVVVASQAPVVAAAPPAAAARRLLTTAAAAMPIPMAQSAGAQDATVTMLVPNLGNEVFDPFNTLNDDSNFMHFFAAPLVEGDGKGGLAPGVFSSWESNADATIWTFTVRPGVKAHNGEDITLDEVVWNLDSRFGDAGKARIQAAEPVFGPIVSLANIVKSISAAPPDKVVMELTTPKTDVPFVLSANFPDSEGYVIPSDYFKSVGAAGFNAAPVGTGPFKLVSHTPGQEMVFERFDDFYYQPANGLPEDRRPQFKTLILRVVPEPATRISALQAGQADIIAANPQMVPQIDQAGGSVAYAQEGVFPRVTYIGCWDPSLWCYKKEVRQALEYAIDKQTLLSQLYGPDAGAVKGWTVATPSAVGYVPGVTDPFPYDVEKAKALLAQAGYPGGQGLPTINIRVYDTGSVPFLPELAQVFVESWKSIGVNAVFVPGDPDTTYSTWFKGGYAGDLLLGATTTLWLGSDYASVLYTDPTFPIRLCGDPASTACQPLTTSIDKNMKVVYQDDAARNAGFGQAYTVLRDADFQWSPFYLHQPWGVGPRIAGYTPWPLNAYPTAVWTIGVK